MESVTYNRADITFDGATYSNLWSIIKSGVAVETFVKGEGIKIRQTASNTLYIYDEETRVYITYPNPALLPTDLSTINGWVGSTGGGGDASSANQLTEIGLLEDILDNQTNGNQVTRVTGSITATTVNTSYAVRLDSASATITYVGKAEIGSNESSPVWQIMRITSGVSGETIEYADTGGFDQVWTNRASLTYA